jgi:S-DNA-T family DNA segregation ATPase FtsK/SpoIIIE
MSRGTRHEVLGIVLMAAAIVAYLALAGQSEGALGSLLARGLWRLFGFMAWWVPALVGAWGLFNIIGSPAWASSRRWVLVGAASWVLDGLGGLYGVRTAGYVGYGLGHGLALLVGSPGAGVLLGAALLALLILLTGQSVGATARGLGTMLAAGGRRGGSGSIQMLARLRDWLFPVEDPEPVPSGPVLAHVAEADPPVSVPVLPDPPRPVESDAPGRRRPAPPEDQEPLLPAHLPPAGHWALPSLDLLAKPEPVVGGRAPEQRAKVLLETLRQFGIDARLADVRQGPAVTRFEVIPPPGVKVSRIVGLADDIALSLAARGVRMEAPIPGKSAIGIEVPNEDVAVVRLREVLESGAYLRSRSVLTVALGKDISGQPVVAALDEMPHLLVAGSTGSGKSVLINVLIASLLFRASPDMLQLLLVDPKVVELSAFNGIPHLVAPVVTDPKKASRALRWAVQEMERRYQVLATRGVRDIRRYNADPGDDGPLPYIVVVIDELADLMMVAPVEVEESIARLAQMARAAGIHLVVATQRPSVDVITGTIKANIPSRIAFAVSSQVDSRTILDGAGAEKLLGRGDMLFHPVGEPKPLRLQGAFVQEQEIERLVAALRQGPPPDRPPVEFVAEEEGGVTSDTDSLFQEALRIVVESRQASASLLQRRLRVGYTRAARIIDQMAERGYVGPQDGARPRDVYLTPEQFARLFSDTP